MGPNLVLPLVGMNSALKVLFLLMDNFQCLGFGTLQVEDSLENLDFNSPQLKRGGDKNGLKGNPCQNALGRAVECCTGHPQISRPQIRRCELQEIGMDRYGMEALIAADPPAPAYKQA